MSMLAVALAAELLLSAPAVAPGAESQPQPAAPKVLHSFEEVKALCASLRRLPPVQPGMDPASDARAQRDHAQVRAAALAREYRVDVGGKGFAFGRYRADAAEQELDGDRPLRAASGALLLDLAGIDDVAFTATAADVARWSALRAKGELVLSVVFHPSEEGCSGNAAAHSLRLAGTPTSWRLLDAAGKPVAAAGEDGRPTRRLDPSSPRLAHVQSVTLEEETPPADDGRARLGSAQSALDRCAQAARSSGALILSFAVRHGAIDEVHVVMDGVRDDATSGCVAKALAGLSLAGASQGRGTATLAVE